MDLKLEVVNVVATCALGAEFDLSRVLLILPDAEYDPEHFHALVYRDKQMHGSLLLNASGIVVATGFKSLGSLEEALDDLVKVLRTDGYRIQRGKTKVQNMVFVANVGRRLDLARIALALPKAEYEPEQFPGVIVRFESPRASVLVFRSGRIILAGATSKPDAELVLREVIPLLS